MKSIYYFIFGPSIKGEPINLEYKIPQPTKVTNITNRPSQDEWAREFKFGTRYGYRGSFYQK